MPSGTLAKALEWARDCYKNTLSHSTISTYGLCTGALFYMYQLLYYNMENTDKNSNDNEVKPKQVYSEAHKKAAWEFHERNKDNEEYKQKRES